MCDYVEQLERVRRFLQRVRGVPGRNSDSYRDDLWSFFQNAWHLKDWIKNDPSIPQAVRNRVLSAAESDPRLMICADLCNRSKHLKLQRIRVNADVTPGQNVEVFPATAGSTEVRESEYTHSVVLADGTRWIAQDLASDIVDNWTRILSDAGLQV